MCVANPVALQESFFGGLVGGHLFLAFGIIPRNLVDPHF